MFINVSAGVSQYISTGNCIGIRELEEGIEEDFKRKEEEKERNEREEEEKKTIEVEALWDRTKQTLQEVFKSF